MRLRAPAKINLALHVTGRLSDGYHEIDSLVVFTELGDELTVETARADSFRIEGPFADAIPGDGDNLVLRARDLFRQRHSFTQPLSITLTKNLPPASGIGGGSSDAAACLAAMAEIARSDVSLSSTGATLGADVPMCLAAEPLIARGIGEEISLVSSFPSLAMVLVNPGVEVPTPEIFLRLSSPNNTPLPPLEHPNDVVDWLSSCRNDLQEPALGYAPIIAEVLAALDACGARLARMSGSGATCFGIFPDMVSANRAAEQLHARQPSWFVKATRSHASGEFRR
ncbi:4-(cytidine 5'-diphospho)-2-C-methyl-D-erythritol kinase [Aliihoeflea sp. PC F10.4]